GAIDAMPSFEAPFDKVLAVNVYMFWPDPVGALAKLASVMKPGATLALTFQPRQRGAAHEARGGPRARGGPAPPRASRRRRPALTTASSRLSILRQPVDKSAAVKE